MKRYLILLVLFTVLLAGCGPEVEELVPTALPVSTDAPTDTPTSLPISISTLTLHPSTKTPRPTVPTRTATQRPFNEPELLATIAHSENVIRPHLAFSPDSKTIALGAYTVRLWDVSSKEQIHKFEFQKPEDEYPYQAINIAFSSDGNLLAVVLSDCAKGFLPKNRLVVWNIASEELVLEMDLDSAVMTYAYHSPEVYDIAVDAISFIPGSTRLVYANGNRIEIRDVFDDEAEPDVLNLGREMYADEITIRGDGEFVCIFMEWYKTHTFPALYRVKYRAQVWHINTQTIRRDLRFEDVDLSFEEMYLAGPYLVHSQRIPGTLQAQNLYNEQVFDFPYRRGDLYFSEDASRMLAVRYWGIEEEENGLEVWNTGNWRVIYDFKPSFFEAFFPFFDDAALSPDNNLLVLEMDGIMYLWNLNPDVEEQ